MTITMQWTALVISNIAVGDADLSLQLGNKGCCQALAKVLASHLKSRGSAAEADMMEEILHAVGAVCKTSPVNRHIFASHSHSHSHPLSSPAVSGEDVERMGSGVRDKGSSYPSICASIVRAVHRYDKVDCLVEQGLFALSNLLDNGRGVGGSVEGFDRTELQDRRLVSTQLIYRAYVDTA